MTSKRKTVAGLGMSALLAATVLGACGSSGGAKPSSAGTSGNQSGNQSTDKSTFCQGGFTDVSYAGPMSGSEANYGQQQYDGLKLAVDAVNSQGGFNAGPLQGCKIKLLGPYDDRSDPSTGASIANRLATNSQLLTYFGDVDSGVTVVALPILSRAGIPMINSYSSSPKITSLGYHNIFRTILNDNTQGSAMADLMVKKFGMKRLVALWPNDVFGQGISAAFLSEAKKLGADVVVNYSYPTTSTDFSVMVSRVRSANADGIALLGVYSGDAIAVKQLVSGGVKPSSKVVFMGNASDNTSQFVSIAGAGAAEGVYLTGIWDPGNANPAGKAFTTQFEQAYGGPPAEDAATAYDALMVFAKAVESGGGNRASLVQALHGISPSNPYQGITGNIGFGADGQAQNLVPALLQIQNGKIVAAPNS